MAEERLEIGSGEDAVKIIQRHLDERRWWIIPVGSAGASSLASSIERAYYEGEKNQYFNMLVMTERHGSMLPFAFVYFAHKEYMTMEDMKSFLKVPEGYELGDGSEADLRDILWTTDAPEEFIMWFMKTFKGDPNRGDSLQDPEIGGTG